MNTFYDFSIAHHYMINGVAIVANLIAFIVVRTKMRWLSLSCATISWLVIALFIYNDFDSECARQPKLVEFHQGMKLCPGQSAILSTSPHTPEADQRI